MAKAHFKRLPAHIKLWACLSAASCILAGLVYVAVQQNYRLSANDPQIQLAEDGATALGRGTAPADIVGSESVEVASSLAPFVTVFDANRHALATSGRFEGETLSPPAGSFDYARKHGQNRFTWEPRPGAREAAVLVYNSGSHPGYVLAARSLTEVEAREDQLLFTTALALALLLACAAAVVMFK